MLTTTLLLYNPEHADAGMEHWSRAPALYAAANTYRPTHAFVVLNEMRKLDAVCNCAFRRTLTCPAVITAISMFVGGMHTYMTMSQTNKTARTALIGSMLTLDSRGHRPWVWPLKYALPCPRTFHGDGVATAPLVAPLSWASYLSNMSPSQRHACLLIQTSDGLRVLVVITLFKTKHATPAWPKGAVKAVLSIVDGSNAMPETSLHSGTIVSVQVMASRSSRRHLYLCYGSKEPLFILQLAM